MGCATAAVRRATLLMTGDRLWTATARTIFWNRGIVEAALLTPLTTPFPPFVTPVDVGPDGVVHTAAGPLARPLVVAPATVTLAGEMIAGRQPGERIVAVGGRCTQVAHAEAHVFPPGRALLVQLASRVGHVALQRDACIVVATQ